MLRSRSKNHERREGIVVLRRLRCCALLSAAITASHAQSPQWKADLFAGYSYLNGAFTLKNLNGWNASLAIKPKPWFGVVADFSGHYYGGICNACYAHNFLFGPQVLAPLPKITPFARVLVGGESIGPQYSPSPSLAIAVGGGADYHWTGRLSLRGQVDLLHTDFVLHNQGGYAVSNSNIRVSTGIVFRF